MHFDSKCNRKHEGGGDLVNFCIFTYACGYEMQVAWIELDRDEIEGRDMGRDR